MFLQHFPGLQPPRQGGQEEQAHEHLLHTAEHAELEIYCCSSLISGTFILISVGHGVQQVKNVPQEHFGMGNQMLALFERLEQYVSVVDLLFNKPMLIKD